jgi:hypothetical protein
MTYLTSCSPPLYSVFVDTVRSASLMALRTLLPAQNGAGSGDNMHLPSSSRLTPQQDVSVFTRSVDHGASDGTVRKQAEMPAPPRDAEIRAQLNEHDHSA